LRLGVPQLLAVTCSPLFRGWPAPVAIGKIGLQCSGLTLRSTGRATAGAAAFPRWRSAPVNSNVSTLHDSQMKANQHSLATSAALIILSGCATNVTAPSDTSISSSSYNEALAKQGVSHYCGDSKCDTAPTLIAAVAPIYPPAALQARVSGSATVSFSIDKSGVPVKITLTSASSPEFGQAALATVANWRYKPALLKGTPTEIGPLIQNFPFSPNP
jgi:TonB family protein